jgi:hypothetical protein
VKKIPTAERLADVIRVRSHFQRSVNLERDANSEFAAHYIPTARAIDTVRSWVWSMVEDDRPRAWSITGPYGSGKSSFALFLEALASGAECEPRAAAVQTLTRIHPEIADLLDAGRAALGATDKGLILAAATAEREPAASTILRALRIGAANYWSGRPPRTVSATLALASNRTPRVEDVIRALEAVAEFAPVLLIIDEFGKNLEAFADAGAAADLFVLQEVAERVSGASGLPVFFFTLQHLAFTDYAAGLTEHQRREWTKVQGRFEDVAFLDSPDQAIHLLAGAFDTSTASPSLGKRIGDWATNLWKRYSDLGLTSYFGESPALIAACYPLHPLAVLALPELCARYAQHSRTLFSFVGGPEPGTVLNFLQTADSSRGLPVVTLDDVYRYFVESASSMIAGSGEGSRWLEIERRIRETQGLNREEELCLRTIAVLNLISAGGALRASLGAITLTLATGTPPIDSARAGRLVRGLEKRGLVTYRSFADEYRIWQGSDFDVVASLNEAKERLRQRPLAELLEAVASPAPVVASRHSQRTGILRYFPVRFVDGLAETIEIPSEADGVLIYQVGELSAEVKSKLASQLRPAVIVAPAAPDRLREAALDLAAHHEVLDRSEALISDWVARREIQERESAARQSLAALLREGFASPGNTRVLAESGEQLDNTVSLPRLISDLCDRFYPAAPEVRNEMIARRELTSQGSKARRELLNAMVTSQNVERLGLSGFGPDRAMYEAVLAWPELHSATPDGHWAFQPPPESSSWQGAWQTIAGLLEVAKKRHVLVSDIWATLMAPPVGLKDGPIPVLFTAAILYWADEVALYQDGTYQPIVDGALIERLLKTPERFSIKAFGLAGARGEVIDAVGEVFGIQIRHSATRRNSTVLSVMAPLLTKLRSLPAHAHHTLHLSPEAIAVRQALSTSREPDRLLFEDLPQACGIEPFGPGPVTSRAKAKQFAERLYSLMSELEAAYPRLAGEIHDSMVREFGIPGGRALREDLRGRAGQLADKVLDPKLRSPLLMACDENLEDEDWLEAMAMTIGDRPPQEWRDAEVEQFKHSLHAVATAFARIEALHFERRAVQREGFDARRVTVTSPDGSEVSRVVWIDSAHEVTISDVAADALRAIDARIGPGNRAALLAILAKQLYAEDQPSVVSDLYGNQEEISNA